MTDIAIWGRHCEQEDKTVVLVERNGNYSPVILSRSQKLLSCISMMVLVLPGLATVTDLAAQKRRNINIFITTANDPTGFITPLSRELADSAKDLRSALRARRGLRLVEQPGEADIVIEVTNRETVTGDGSVGVGSVVATGPTTATAVSRNSPVLRRRVRLAVVAGENTFDFVAEHAAWRRAAEILGRQIQDFAKDNYDKIISK